MGIIRNHKNMMLDIVYFLTVKNTLSLNVCNRYKCIKETI